jgi:hypothetical protein
MQKNCSKVTVKEKGNHVTYRAIWAIRFEHKIFIAKVRYRTDAALFNYIRFVTVCRQMKKIQHA